VCCSVVQFVAVCCSALQCVAVRCSVLQCVAVQLTGVEDGNQDALEAMRLEGPCKCHEFVTREIHGFHVSYIYIYKTDCFKGAWRRIPSRVPLTVTEEIYHELDA